MGHGPCVVAAIFVANRNYARQAKPLQQVKSPPKRSTFLPAKATPIIPCKATPVFAAAHQQKKVGAIKAPTAQNSARSLISRQRDPSCSLLKPRTPHRFLSSFNSHTTPSDLRTPIQSTPINFIALFASHNTKSHQDNYQQWLAPSRPPASPPVERLPVSSSPPRPLASRRPLPEASRSLTVTSPVPSLFVRFVATRSPLSS